PHVHSLIESLLTSRVALFEKAKELSAGRVERALLIFGFAVGDERSTFIVEDREHDLVCRPLSEPRVLMQSRDDLAAENPQVIAVRPQGLARRARTRQMAQKRLEAFHHLLAMRQVALFIHPASWPLFEVWAISCKLIWKRSLKY